MDTDNFDPTQVHIWAIDDIEWWVGAGTREQIKLAVVEAYGDVFEGDDQYPELVSDSDLDSLMFNYSGAEEIDRTLTRSFREQLAIEIADGGDMPRMFACTEI
jgi:hypothetical protein